MILFSMHRHRDGYEASAKNDSGWRRRFREVWQAFGSTPRAFRLVWDCSRPVALVMAGLTLLAAALPAAQAWVAKLIVQLRRCLGDVQANEMGGVP